MERNVLLTIAYDGHDFSGWQRQQNQRTVQGEIEKALSRLCNMPIEINGTSRTDAGVHALGQRASFSGDFAIPTANIPRALNNILASNGKVYSTVGDIKILAAEDVPMNFHPRYNCIGKKYRYIFRCAEPDVFRKNYAYQINEKPDFALMQEAAKHIVGTHDFACFQAAGGTPRKTTVRTVHSLELAKTGDEIIMEITGDGFLYNMVRIIAGTLLDVGRGRIDPTEISSVIKSGNRQKAGHTAPACGLYLVEIYFERNLQTWQQ